MFAARGGAAAVVGLDGSERIAGYARQVRMRMSARGWHHGDWGREQLLGFRVGGHICPKLQSWQSIWREIVPGFFHGGASVNMLEALRMNCQA
jgi:hypothetical protein